MRPFDIFTSEACGATTGHTAEAYPDRAIASRGLWMWLGALCPSLQDSREVADFRRVMPQLFDDYDDDLFRPGPR